MPRPVKRGKRKGRSSGASKSSRRTPENRYPVRQFADNLDRIRITLAELAKQVYDLHTALYTRGLDGRGPVTESADDIPF